MSSLRGEEALKDGLSFEFTWTARHLLEVMEERAHAITLGGLPGETGVDFRLHFADHEEHHQVKRAFGSKGEWTFAALDSEKILSDFRQRLADPKVHCYMVSSIPAVRLGHLASRARKSLAFSTFESDYLTAEYSDWFDDLVKRWDLTREECWLKLQRVHTCPFYEQDQASYCLTMLRPMVVKDPEHAWAHLRDFCFHHVHQRVTASEVWQWLTNRGIERQIVDDDPRVLARLHTQTRQYLNGVRRKLINPPLPRQLASTIVGILTDAAEAEDIVVLGSPGGGKSAVMLQIADACVAKGWPVLAFRLDELSASISARELQNALDLPLSPAASMARASAGKPALVIIDQLDAVSQYSGRTGTLFDRVCDFLQELRAHRQRNPIHLVTACREVDWRHDGRFRPLHRSKPENENEGIHKVEDLNDEEIKVILMSTGFDAAMFSPRQRELLLRRPQHLALLIEANPEQKVLKGIITPKHLFDAYWTKKERDLSLALPSAGNPWFDILKYITEKLAETALALNPPAPSGSDDEAPLAVTRSSLGRFPPAVLDWMITNGVLSEGNNRIRFGHESFFDYCFARFFEARDQTVLEYLLQSDQTLIQRGQLRQILAYQRDEDLNTYLTSARELLASDRIRPHLQHLLATVVCEIPDPKESEWALIAPIICESLNDIEAGANTSVRCLILSAFHNSLPLFKMACEDGTMAGWLQRCGPLAIDSLFRVILKHQEKAQPQAWTLLKPLIDNGLHSSHREWLSHFCKASESRETFEWLVCEMRKSYASDEQQPDPSGRFYSLAEDLAKNKPEWLAEWLASVIREKTALGRNSTSYELLRDDRISAEKIASAAAQAPRAFLDHLLPAIADALQTGNERPWGVWSEYGYYHESEGGFHYVSPDEATFKALVQALHQMIDSDVHYAVNLLTHLRNSELAALQKLHAAALCYDGDLCAELASSYLAHGGTALSVMYKDRLAACEMLKIHASRFSDQQFAAIESVALDCRPEREQQKQEVHAINSPKTCLGNWRGYRQMEVLRAFPRERLSAAGARRLDEWERKFDSVQRLYGPARRDTPFNKEAISAWRPERFLQGIVARLEHLPQSWHTSERHGGKVGSIMSEVVAKRPAEFIHYLAECDSHTPDAFIEGIDSGLMNLDLDPGLALEAAKHFHRLGSQWSWRFFRLLEKVKAGDCILEAFNLALEHARTGSGVTQHQAMEEGKQGERLYKMASTSDRGRAIEVLRQMLWADPELLPHLKPFLTEMMSDPCPAIRTELASLCYAVAFKEENRQFATELFVQLATDHLPDEHVLTSHWSFQFMRASLERDWDVFSPILVKMLASSSSEVRSTAARLICIAVVSGVDALALARECAASSDPKVRATCADVLSHNLDVDEGKPWTIEALLALADDPDKDVCRATALGFNRSKGINFAPLADLLTRYVKTRAFVRSSGSLIDALAESRSVLPATIFDIVETLLARLDEPVEGDSDRLVWHIDRMSPILARLYHENRDGPLRRRALDLIDQLCVKGSVSHESLDL